MDTQSPAPHSHCTALLLILPRIIPILLRIIPILPRINPFRGSKRKAISTGTLKFSNSLFGNTRAANFSIPSATHLSKAALETRLRGRWHKCCKIVTRNTGAADNFKSSQLSSTRSKGVVILVERWPKGELL